MALPQPASRGKNRTVAPPPGKIRARLHPTKDSVVCRDAYIRGEEELMPEVFGAAMHGDHDRLRAMGWPQADRVDE